MKTKFVLFVVVFAFVIHSASAQSAAAEISLADRTKSFPAIFEGRVLAKTCFWNQEHTGIFTANIIEVYKVFKGNIVAARAEVITPGGMVGAEIEDVSSGIELKTDDTGIFFCDYSPVLNSSSDISLSYCYELFMGTQGFIKYDLADKAGRDAYKKYPDIEQDVYSVISSITSHPYKIIRPFSIKK